METALTEVLWHFLPLGGAAKEC